MFFAAFSGSGFGYRWGGDRRRGAEAWAACLFVRPSRLAMIEKVD